MLQAAENVEIIINVGLHESLEEITVEPEQQATAERIVDLLSEQVVERMEVAQIISKDELSVDVPMPKFLEDSVEIIQHVPEECILE